MTARSQLRLPTLAAHLTVDRTPRTGRRPRPRGVVDHEPGLTSEPLTPCRAPPRCRLTPTRSRGAETAFAGPRVNAGGVPGRGAFHRRVPPRTAYAACGDPPPIPGRIRLGPAPDASSPVPLSRHWLGPPRRHGLFTRGRRGPAPPVDFCNRTRSTSTTPRSSEPRPPHRQSPTEAAAEPATPARDVEPERTSRLHGGWPQTFQGGGERQPPLGRTTLARAPFRVAANRDDPGQGPPRDEPGSAPLAAIARFESFTPTSIGSSTSCRELVASQAGVACPARRAEDRVPHGELAGRTRSREPSSEGRLARAPAKERRARLHPRCLPSADGLESRPGPVLHNLSPACGLRGTGAFFFR